MAVLLVIYWLGLGVGVFAGDWSETTFITAAFVGGALLLGVCWAIREALS